MAGLRELHWLGNLWLRRWLLGCAVLVALRKHKAAGSLEFLLRFAAALHQGWRGGLLLLRGRCYCVLRLLKGQSCAHIHKSHAGGLV